MTSSSVDINAFRKLIGKDVPPVPVYDLDSGGNGLLTDCILLFILIPVSLFNFDDAHILCQGKSFY